MTKKSQLIIIFITVFIYLVGFGVIIPILPLLAKQFGASSLQVGLLMSVYSAMQFLFAPFWGRLSDRLGRRPILLFCLVGEALAYILFATARSLEWLFIARAFAGFFGASISTASAYISDITPPQERSKGMALIGAAFGLGFMVGPAVGGLLAQYGQTFSADPYFGTSFAAFGVACLCVVNFIFGFKFLTESLAEKNKVKEQPKRLKQMMIYAKRPLLGPMIGVYFLSSLSMAAMEATLILFVGEKFQWGIKQVSYGFAYIGLISILTQGLFVRRLLPLMGERKMMSLGLAFMALSFSLIGLSHSIPVLAIAMTFLGFGNSFTNPSVLGSISLISAPQEQGAVLGTTQGTASLGRIIGPAFGGFIYQAVHMTSPFFSSALMSCLGLMIVLSLYQQLPHAAKKA